MVGIVFDDEPECIICLSNKYETKGAVTVQTLDTLKRSCNCKYLIHEPCLKIWIMRSPLCPICHQLLLFKTDLDTTREIKINDQTYPTASSRLYICFILVIILIIIFSTTR